MNIILFLFLYIVFLILINIWPTLKKADSFTEGLQYFLQYIVITFNLQKADSRIIGDLGISLLVCICIFIFSWKIIQNAYRDLYAFAYFLLCYMIYSCISFWFWMSIKGKYENRYKVTNTDLNLYNNQEQSFTSLGIWWFLVITIITIISFIYIFLQTSVKIK
tara:strand:- start:1741 stop:2229 length:489 start_codon:yes stop_codon:yes gene_type:complete